MSIAESERVFAVHFEPAAGDTPARVAVALVGGAREAEGALILGAPCGSPEELDGPIDALVAALETLKRDGRRRLAAAASADSPAWRERFTLMGLPAGAGSWRGRLALHLVARADEWRPALGQADPPPEVLAGVQIAQIGEHTRIGRNFETRQPTATQRQVQRLLAAVLAEPDADCTPLRDGDRALGRFARWHFACDSNAGEAWVRRRRIDQPDAPLALFCTLKAWSNQSALRALELAATLPPLVESMTAEAMVERLLARS